MSVDRLFFRGSALCVTPCHLGSIARNCVNKMEIIIGFLGLCCRLSVVICHVMLSGPRLGTRYTVSPKSRYQPQIA